MKSKRVFMYFLFSLTTIGVFGCLLLASNEKVPGSYNLELPSDKISLPDTLREISGLTVVDESTVGCVQDENGILFLYDIEREEIKQQIPFGPNGDYEGLARVGDDMYILRSDGMLYHMKNYSGKRLQVDSFPTNIPATNNEGLCYDRQNDRLLIASKVASSRESKTQRMVYAFDVKDHRLSESPVFTFDSKDIRQFARQHNIALPQKLKKKDGTPKDHVRFKPSAISIHPVTRKIYMLSAADHMLFVFDQSGAVEDVRVLDKLLFNKSEGITFLNNATMLISNEGQENRSNILVFRPSK